ncbi:MAG: acetylesterase, partial [Oscillospiraceae bacterium]|nr:acetylesterase [Oscillospiraceae bacterium]
MNILIPCDNFGPAMTPADHPPFKTLYLLNGHSGSKNDWLLSGDVQNVSNLYDIAIVIPSGDNSFYTDNPYYEQLYSEFIGHELVNYTRSILPLSDKREDTYIAGLSMGGYGTIHNSMRHSDVFGHAIALSTPFEDFYKEATDEPNFMGITKSYYVSLFGPEDKFDTSDANLKFLAKKTHEAGFDVPDLY